MRTDERCIDRIARRTMGQLKEGRLLGHLCHFSLHVWVTSHLIELDCAS
jgi:hypothetical protein